MVGQAIQQPVARFRGLRPFVASRDLSQVALLLESAFREDLGMLHLWSRVPVLREMGALLWAASFAPVMSDALLGFVWEEEGHIIGNVTLTPDDARRGYWMISNVAVEEKYRRHGIARQMMDATLDDAKRRGAKWLILNVRPHNVGAIKLYDELGFDAIDTEMSYTRNDARELDGALPLRPLRANERSAALELARRGMSPTLRMFRPVRASDFAINFEDRLTENVVDFFAAQRTERYGYFETGALRATVTLRAQKVGTPHALDVRVAPEARGRVEDGVLAYALTRLAGFPRRRVTARALTSHKELVEALTRAKFVPLRGLMLMAKEL
jgi:ribosomal protein S18 acetylase RimI-like enzyme